MLYPKLLEYLNRNPNCFKVKLKLMQFYALYTELNYRDPASNIPIPDNFWYRSFSTGNIHICHEGSGIQYPYVDLDDYYDRVEKDYNPDKYCSHSWAIYEGFSEKYNYCVYCGKTEDEILKRP